MNRASSSFQFKYHPIAKEPERVTAIDLTKPESIQNLLSPKNYAIFIGENYTASEKTRVLRELWLLVPNLKIIVPSVSQYISVLITQSYLTFPKSDIAVVEGFFDVNPTWTPYGMSLLLGICLRHKQQRIQGNDPYCRDSSLNSWPIAQIKTVGGVVSKIDLVYRVKQDELELIKQGYVTSR